MAIAVYYHPKAMRASEYDEVLRRLGAIGLDRPAGCLHHSCFGEDGSLMVYDVWESADAFDVFRGSLVPIMEEVGIEATSFDIVPVHHMLG